MARYNPLIQKDLTEQQLREYVIEKDRDLDKDYSERVSGITNASGNGKKMAGYTDLRKFYEGDQWTYLPESGIQPKVYNYCRTTVNNYVSFLSDESPEDDVPPRDPTDDIEIARVEQVEKLIRDIKRDNQFSIQFSEATLNQSLLGDSFIFGPYVEWVLVGKRKIPRIKFSNLKRVENVRLIWADEDFSSYTGFIIYNRMLVEKAEKLLQEQMRKRDIARLASNEPYQYSKESGLWMVTLKTYFDDTYMLAMVDDTIVDFVKHGWGFVPGRFVTNLPHPTRPYGVSDIEDILDSQTEYNETACDTRGKIKQVAIPHVFYAGEGEPVQYQAGNAQMIKIGAEDKIFPDPMGQSTAPFEAYASARKGDLMQLSMVSEIFYGGGTAARMTGRALSVLMQGINKKVKLKQERWRVALENLNANILHLVELYVPNAKKLIQGYYKTDVFLPSVLIRNVTDEINKFNMKLQSQQTTMKNLGIPSVSEEQKVMKKEWSDMELAIEISRSPQLRMQLQQALTQQMAGAGKPMLTEGEGGAGTTAEESMPMSTPQTPQQAPTSKGGAIAQKGFRGT